MSVTSARAVSPAGREDGSAAQTIAQLNVGARGVAPGEAILSRGEVAEGPLRLQRGWAAQCLTLADGRCQITGFVLPGDLIGVASVIGWPSDHDVAALTVGAVETAPAVGERDLLSAALREAATLREHAARNGRRSAKERMAHLLLELHARLFSVGLAGADALPLPIGQNSLADALGLSYVHVSRVMTALTREGLISRGRGQVAFKDKAALEALCSFSPLYLQGGGESRAA